MNNNSMEVDVHVTSDSEVSSSSDDSEMTPTLPNALPKKAKQTKRRKMNNGRKMTSSSEDDSPIANYKYLKARRQIESRRLVGYLLNEKGVEEHYPSRRSRERTRRCNVNGGRDSREGAGTRGENDNNFPSASRNVSTNKDIVQPGSGFGNFGQQPSMMFPSFGNGSPAFLATNDPFGFPAQSAPIPDPSYLPGMNNAWLPPADNPIRIHANPEFMYKDEHGVIHFHGNL